MSEQKESEFVLRSVVFITLPLMNKSRILRPEQVVVKVGNDLIDLGALCYAKRSDNRRKPRQPRLVVPDSLIKQRPKQILQVVKSLSNLATAGGRSLPTTAAYAWTIIAFVNCADANGHYDCLAGGKATLDAFRVWTLDTYERYRLQQFSEKKHNFKLSSAAELLEAITGLTNLMQGARKLAENNNPNGGTEALGLHDFSHAIALNQCIFDGLCDLVLERKPFPFKLELPRSLGWVENHLWLFPTNIWRLPLQAEAVTKKDWSKTSWAYDYKNGRLATVDEIEHRYRGNLESERRKVARHSIKNAMAKLKDANDDVCHQWRYTLAMHAQRAFLFLFYCNTGGNSQVIRELETTGNIESSTQSQKFRGLKWRAGGKRITLICPVAFMPSMRRFMELRQYLLGERHTQYLFFNCGNRNNAPPGRMGDADLELHYRGLLLEIDPHLPKMGSRKLRATVNDYYVSMHDSVVAAAVMGHTVETELKKYGRGSSNAHHEDLSAFMASVSEAARRQRVVAQEDAGSELRPLESGGSCGNFGYPEPLSSVTPIVPNCANSQGCLFCNCRIVIAGEEDARKIASAAYVMEQLVCGPKHEEALRPLISKCDEDLEKIAAFPKCQQLVEKIRIDVYQNENLTPFWADKLQLFLELGIIS